MRSINIQFDNLNVEVPLIYDNFYLMSLYSEKTESLDVFFSQSKPLINKELRYVTFGDRRSNHKLALETFKGKEYKDLEYIIKHYKLVETESDNWEYEEITD